MTEKRFHCGDVICHRLYGYRGVVVAGDETCQAEDAWYRMQTEGKPNPPTKLQPWYHVLVDGREHTTYVAEQNMQLDPSGEPVQHPLLPEVFKTFFRGRYYREVLN